jgi:putative ABC transport system permease protein
MRGLLNGVRLAFRSIGRNMLRASLTVLGILIGVWAVVCVTALGAGARDSVGSQLENLGSNLVIVFPTNSAASGAHGAQGAGKRLSEDDGRAIMREAVSVQTLTPMLRARAQAVYGDRNWSTNVIGTTIPYLFIRSWKLQRGDMWTEHDEAVKSKVCILGSTAAKNLFGDEDPVGRTIRIGRYPYRIMGVLESKGETPFGEDQDDQIAMPIGSMRARIMRTPPGFAGALFVSATSPETTERAVSQIDSILRQRHHIATDRETDFEIVTQKEFQAMQRVIFDVLTFMLIFIALISLVVGGIGVMNIMLVSVTERTREIGIRMAIGAREGDIRSQFLVEAVVLAVLGGAAGAFLGISFVAILGLILKWKMSFSPMALTISVLVSGVTGIVFGFFPARRASRLDPIEALRHE